MAIGDAAGFWSYTHRDDQLDGGRILRLAEKLQAEFALLTGAELNLFIDRDGIKWGDEWRSRIDKALLNTTYFIAILTPSYFSRPECRRELLTFIGHARNLGLEELLLPIHYALVPELEENQSSTDDAIRKVAATQWVDWRGLRLVDEESSEYRQAVNRLASRLVEVSERLAERYRSPLPPAVAVVDQDNDEEPGFVELMAAAEEALPRWGAIIPQIPVVLKEIDRLADDWMLELFSDDAAGKGFADLLSIAQRFGARFEAPADKLAKLGSSYASEVGQINPAILALIRAAEEFPADAQTEEGEELLDSIQGIAGASREYAEKARDLETAFDEMGSVIRAVRGPVRTIQQGLRGILDAQVLIDEWDERISRLRQA